jgi:arylsulfatase
MKKALILLIIITVSFCCAVKKTTREPLYNLLVIVSDALRADALSCYGGEADTPNISQLAAEGVLFENAYSNSSWTVPSSISMFTGTYPAAFGQLVIENPDIAKNRPPFFMVNDRQVLLAEALGKKGYDVYYDLESGLASRSNVTQGFTNYKQNEYYASKSRWFWKKAMQPEFEGQIYDKDVPIFHYLFSTERKFFFMKWIFDPHTVYSPPENFKAKINVDVSKLTRDREYYERIGSKHDPGPDTLQEVGPTFNEHELRYLKDLYLKEIESVDERVGYILKALDSKGLRDKTIIVFTSDHGESFGEQGLFGHGGLFYEERVHVPLIISGPGIVRGKRVKESVSHIDLMPTLKDLLMVDCLHNAQGKSYRSVLVDEKSSLEDREIYFTLGEPLNMTAQKIQDGLKYKNYKMIMLSKKNIRLFDLIEDPDELHDLSKKKKNLVEEMKAKIMAIREENERRKQENLKNLDPRTLKKVNEETLKQLRALGYIK